MGRPLHPLTREQHHLAAELIARMEDDLRELTNLACDAFGAAYTTAALKVHRQISHKLVKPLRVAWTDGNLGADYPYSNVRCHRCGALMDYAGDWFRRQRGGWFYCEGCYAELDARH
jgi:hypothetical protein